MNTLEGPEQSSEAGKYVVKPRRQCMQNNESLTRGLGAPPRVDNGYIRLATPDSDPKPPRKGPLGKCAV